MPCRFRLPLSPYRHFRLRYAIDADAIISDADTPSLIFSLHFALIFTPSFHVIFLLMLPLYFSSLRHGAKMIIFMYTF